MFGAITFVNDVCQALTARTVSERSLRRRAQLIQVRMGSIEAEFNAAVAHVAAGHCRRICMPGRWVVWMPEGASKPHARVSQHHESQEAALCNCS